MQVANTRMTLASILGTVQTTASTVSSTMNAVNDAVGMLNKTVSTAAKKQDTRIKLELESYDRIALKESVIATHQAEEVLADYVRNLPEDRHASFIETYNRLAASIGQPTINQ